MAWSGGNEAPENTLAALRSAEAAGSRVGVVMWATASLHSMDLWCSHVC